MSDSMQLTVMKPEGIVLSTPVNCVIAEAPNGSFCLLPRHRDYANALVPGILEYRMDNADPVYVAVDDGLIVKTGDEVQIATRNAIQSSNLEELQQAVVDQFERLDDREKTARSAIVRLEADFVRRFLELGEVPHV